MITSAPAAAGAAVQSPDHATRVAPGRGGPLSLLRCPRCHGSLTVSAAVMVCPQGDSFPIVDGVPQLLLPTHEHVEEDVRRRVHAFYERCAFPGYEEIDSPARLVDKAKRSAFGLWVDRALPPFATVLEAGCGTGQMTNFLGLVRTRTLIGLDQSLASLSLAEGFRRRCDLSNVRFVQGNLFTPPLDGESVDVLICSGVLHHTPNPEGGFRRLLRLLKPGGRILIGLYNRYARVPHGFRKRVFALTRQTGRWLDRRMRRADLSQAKRDTWFADQYLNPHESWHSVDETLRWFDQAQVEYLSTVPRIGPALPGEIDGVDLFRPHPRGGRLLNLSAQLKWILTIGHEGGLFIMVGEKPGPASRHLMSP